MSRRSKYPWPERLHEAVELPCPDGNTRYALQTAASKFANRRQWVFRTRWDGEKSLRVVRAA